jgi:hypothetical protein
MPDKRKPYPVLVVQATFRGPLISYTQSRRRERKKKKKEVIVQTSSGKKSEWRLDGTRLGVIALIPSRPRNGKPLRNPRVVS